MTINDINMDNAKAFGGVNESDGGPKYRKFLDKLGGWAMGLGSVATVVGASAPTEYGGLALGGLAALAIAFALHNVELGLKDKHGEIQDSIQETKSDGMSTGLFADEEDGYNLDETKYVLKGSAPSSDSSVIDEPFDEPSGEDAPMDDLGGLDGLEDAPADDKPFDDEPFDADVEADEDTDPAKYIQQLSGKLGQSLRQYTDDEGQPDFDLEKFAINSVISATHTAEMDKEDQRDIINKVKGSGNEEGGDVDKDVDVDIDVDGADDGAEDLDFGDEPVEEIVEELPLSDTDVSVSTMLSPDNDGMITGCQPPADVDAFETLKDIAESENKTSCWKGYEQIGMKMKSGKEVPNCVPIKENLKVSEKNRIFVDKTKLVKDLRLMENIEPMVKPQPITKPSTKPARPMRETDRPFSPKPRRTTEVQPDPKATVSEEGGVGNSVMFDGKAVEIGSLQIDGVDTNDYPDFVDAYFTYGEYVDGMEMTDEELQKFQEENYDLLSELILEMFH